MKNTYLTNSKILTYGGSDINPMMDMFWGAYWGTCLDQYGIRWMFNFQKQ
jgi:PhnB protein